MIGKLLTGLRTTLRAQVGDASLLPSMPARPGVRIAVIDSAPDATSGHIQPGVSRHGDTLAHLIGDLVCQADSMGVRRCAAEVTTVLALPWIERGRAGVERWVHRHALGPRARDRTGDLDAMTLGSSLTDNLAYVFLLPSSWNAGSIESAYLTGFETSGSSVTEQIFVQQ